MNDLLPEDEALVARARQGLEPGAGDQARIKRRLLVQIAAGTAAATAALSTSAEAAMATGTGLFSVMAKVVAVGLVSAAVVGGGVLATRSTSPAHAQGATSSAARVAARSVATAIPTSTSIPVTAAPPAIATPSATDTARPADAAPNPASALAPPRRAAPKVDEVPAGPNVSAESQLLARAGQAEKEGDLARALELIDEHAARFPGGALYQEREAERAVVLCRTGRTGAQGAGATFVRDYPESPHVQRVRNACGLP